MNFFLKQLAFVLFFLGTCFGQQGQSVVIRMAMPEGSMTRLRYTNDHYELIPISFNNGGTSDLVMEKVVAISKPTFFRYHLQNGPDEFIHQFLALPGDTIRLKFNPNGDIFPEKPDDKLFIESFLNINYLKGAQQQTTDKEGRRQIRQENVRRLQEMLAAHALSKEAFDALSVFSDVAYYLASTASIYRTNTPADEDLDTLFEQIDARFMEFSQIAAFDVLSLYSNLITYKYNKLEKKTLTGLIKLAVADNRGEITQALIKMNLNQQGNKTSAEYTQAIAYLKSLNQEYQKVNVVPKEVLDLPLFMANGKAKSLGEELAALPEKGLLVLDFWASWCVPCLEEFPFSEKLKATLEKSAVWFVPVNMDTDDAVENWLATSKKYPVLFEQRNYRLVDRYKKAMLGFFCVKSIPHYVVISKNATIIDPDFVKPSDALFSENLLKYKQLQRP